jgi:cell fate regulator YaaT (PSP1 superfamily)
MGCSSCSGGSPAGCGDNGHCSSGGCNKKNTYDWISVLDIHDPSAFNIVEVSFKKGARKEFFINESWSNAETGDLVIVETDSGVDTGRISLSGELVRSQMKKKKVNEDRITYKVIRKANERDVEKLTEARGLEKQTLVRARVIARTLGLDMKIGDIEYQGDKRKATFYYTAEGRVDFRELVRSYAKEFKVKVEMRQIGARQESARIGGIGSCGRELCCSTWLSDFQSVTTTAARYQNIAINQTKLSGQCGRLKCCLNYELDTYMDALKDFPKGVDYLKTKRGKAALIKTDIFKGLMYYGYMDEKTRSPMVALDIERVKEIQKINKAGELPEELIDREALLEIESTQEKEIEYADVTGEIELPNIKRKKKRPNRKKRPGGRTNRAPENKAKPENTSNKPKYSGPTNQSGAATPGDAAKKRPSKRRNNRRRPNNQPRNQGPSDTNKNSKE